VIVARDLSGADAAGPRGVARGAVTAVSLALGPGLHAVLGAPEDGTIALGELLAGRRAPSRGWVRWEGLAPHADPGLRRRVAHLAFAPDLPEARDVERSVAAAIAARGGRDGARRARAALEAVGAAGLARRRLSTLTHGEARAVDAAIALSHEDPVLVVAHEPFADRAGPGEEAVERRLRELAAGGACVVLLTSSPRDAARLGDDVLVLERGVVVRGAAAGGAGLVDPPAWPGASPVRAEIVAQIAPPAPGAPGAARAMAKILAERDAAWSVAWDEPPAGVTSPSIVRVAGPDESACALALLEAAAAAGAEVIAVAPVPATLLEVRTTTEQLRVAAAWYARMHAMPAAGTATLGHEGPSVATGAPAASAPPPAMTPPPDMTPSAAMAPPAMAPPPAMRTDAPGTVAPGASSPGSAPETPARDAPGDAAETAARGAPGDAPETAAPGAPGSAPETPARDAPGDAPREVRRS
jgi:ABC-2 type transport system ATP-binding protein